jgi:hypothetical protein
MGNLRNEIGLIVFNVDKNSEAINEKTLIPAFNEDCDFTENEDYFREDTIELGFENEAERVSKEIFDECMADETIQTESELLEAMVKSLFDVDNFIGTSSNYGDYSYQIVETEFEFVVIISYIS